MADLEKIVQEDAVFPLKSKTYDPRKNQETEIVFHFTLENTCCHEDSEIFGKLLPDMIVDHSTHQASEDGLAVEQ